MRRAFVFDQNKCLGCNTCTVACKDWNQVNPGPVRWRTAKVYETEREPVFFPLAMSCNHCANPVCVNPCPTESIVKRPDDGVVYVNRETCIACDRCVNNCPYNAPKRADDIQEPEAISGWNSRHPMQKCNFCMDRLENGRDPVCVESCPVFAVEMGDYNALMEKYKGKGVVQLNQSDFPYAYRETGETDTDPSFLIVKRGPMKFTEDIDPSSTKTVNIGTQTGAVTAGAGGSVTYLVTTENIDVGAAITLDNANNVAGITLVTTATTGNSTTVTISTTADTPAGSHTLTLVIDGVTLASFTLTVEETLAYTISATPPSINIGAVQVFYTQPATRLVTITNSSNSSIVLTQPTSLNYDIGLLSTTNLEANGSTATFTIRPKANLPVGTYNETIAIYGSNEAVATVGVSFAVGVYRESRLVDIPGLWIQAGNAGIAFVEANTLGITNDGEGNFMVTLYGDTNYLTVHGGKYIVDGVPHGAIPRLEVEKDGDVRALDIEEEGAGLYFSETEVVFDHGDVGICKLYVDDVLAGMFRVVYVSDSLVTEKHLEQNVVDGSYYFAPMELLGTGYGYEIISRPKTYGGSAPLINSYGEFSFARQALPVNISRSGEYIVKAAGGMDNVTIFKIVVF